MDDGGDECRSVLFIARCLHPSDIRHESRPDGGLDANGVHRRAGAVEWTSDDDGVGIAGVAQEAILHGGITA